MPEPRSDHAAVALGRHIYVLGGVADGDATTSALRYDAEAGAWEEVDLT